jgi:hypothetical protein
MRRCTGCKVSKPDDEFWRSKGKKDGLCSQCKTCMRAYRQAHRELYRERHRVWGAKHREHVKAYNEAYKPRERELRELNRERRREQNASWARADQQAAIDAYGGFCCCCGETERAFLQLDHIESNGAAHRRETNGVRLAGWLRKRGYPAGFRVLCANCNFGRHINGGVCPHELGILRVVGE